MFLSMTGATVNGEAIKNFSATLNYNYLNTADNHIIDDTDFLIHKATLSIKTPMTLGAYYGRTLSDRPLLWNKLDYGLIGGFGIKINTGITLSARMMYGMADVTNNLAHTMRSDRTVSNQSIFRSDKDKNLAFQISFVFGN
jgi:hypothetical protein